MLISTPWSGVAATLLAAAFVVGCGSSEQTAYDYKKARECLKSHGQEVSGGATRLSQDDRDAPDVAELRVPGAFIAFYSSGERASDGETTLRESAKRLNGTVVRHDTAAILYVPNTGDLSAIGRQTLEDCTWHSG